MHSMTADAILWVSPMLLRAFGFCPGTPSASALEKDPSGEGLPEEGPLEEGPSNGDP